MGTEREREEPTPLAKNKRKDSGKNEGGGEQASSAPLCPVD